MDVKSFSIALLGDAGVGKTSLAIRIAKNTYETKETKGAEYYQKICIYNNQTIKLDIYGTSGLAKYQKISKFLYKDAQTVIIMFNNNVPQSFEHIKLYLDNIKQNCVEKPIIYIVCNCLEPKNLTKEIKFTLDDAGQVELYKYFEICCEKGTGINAMLKELIRDVLIDEKWHFSKIYRDMNDLTSAEQYQTENNLNKNLYNYYKEKKPNFLRCEKCHQLYNIAFKALFNNLSLHCNIDQCNDLLNDNIDISNIEHLMEEASNRVNCRCNKKKDKKDIKHKYNYCLECNSFFCSKCEKTSHKNLESHRLLPYSLMDVACFNCYKDLKIYQKCVAFCKNCKRSFCVKCIAKDQHKRHEIIFFYDNENIKELINESKANLAKERELINELRKNFEDCIISLKQNVTKFLIRKEKEMHLKEQLIDQFSNIKYNYQLHETVKNLKFLKTLKYNKNAQWYQKLTDIYEFIGMPIEINNINISKNNNTEIEAQIVGIKNGNTDYLLEGERKEITDICSMNDKLIGIGYSDGTLEIYENLIEKKSSFTIFEDNQAINSINKSRRNINNYFICGPNRIKKIEFYDNYKSQITLNELVDEEKNYILCLEQDDYIITSDVLNKIVLYSKDNRKIQDISECIDSTHSKNILSINEIANNLIYIVYNKAEGNKEENIRGRCSMPLDLTEKSLDLGELGLTQLDQPMVIDLGTKIIELSRDKIKREYSLPNKQEILGVLSNSMILIREDSQVFLFEANTFKIIKKYSLELGGIPIYLGFLTRRVNLYDFFILDEKLNLFQNIYDEESQTIIQISGLKIKNKVENITKIRKIIQNPFKNIYSYIGDNKFIVINY